MNPYRNRSPFWRCRNPERCSGRPRRFTCGRSTRRVTRFRQFPCLLYTSTRVEAAFEQAFALHRQGRFDEAGPLYQQVLQLQPRHFQALHLLGIMAAQTNRPDRAVELIGKSILVDPQSVAAHNNHGNALCQLNRHAAAIQSYDRAIALESRCV